MFWRKNHESTSNGDNRPPITEFEIEKFGNYGIEALNRYAAYRQVEAETIAEYQATAAVIGVREKIVQRSIAELQRELAIYAIRGNNTTPDEAGARLGYDPDELAAAAAALPEPEHLTQGDELYRQEPPDDLAGPDQPTR